MEIKVDVEGVTCGFKHPTSPTKHEKLNKCNL